MTASHSCCRWIHDKNLPFQHIPKVLDRDLVAVEGIELIVVFKYRILTSFMLEAAMRGWLHCGHEGCMRSNNTQVQ